MPILRERDEELEAIAGTVDQGGLLLVEGVAGIGKSALLEAAAAQAAGAGRRALIARGALLERAYGFGVARQLCEPLLAGRSPQARQAAEVLDAEGHGGLDDGSGFAAIRALAALLVSTAEHGGLLLIVDDAQWSDVPSLELLGFLARRLDGGAIALVVAIRTGEPGAPEELLDELRAARARRVAPLPLGAEATAALLRERAPGTGPELAGRCHEVTGGNPLLIGEVVRALAAGEDPVRHAALDMAGGVRRRIDRADPDALNVARAVAVLGEDATLAHVALLARRDAVDCGRAAAALSRAGVLRPGPAYGFTHPLVADAVLASLGDDERVLSHRAAAALLEAEGAADERVVAHLLATPGTGDPAVVARLRGAARSALARGAPRTAITLLLRALEEPPTGRGRVEVLSELGHAERLAGEAAAVAHLRLALDTTREPSERARLAGELARAENDLSRYEEAAATLTTALREAPDDLPVALRDALRVDVLSVALVVSSLDAGQLVSDLGRGAPPEDPAVAVALQLATLGMRLTGPEPVSTYAGEIEALLRAWPPRPEQIDTHTIMWWAMCMLERFDELRALLDEVEASGPGWMRRQFALNLARARLEQRLGNLDAATAVHEANLEFGHHNASGVLFTLGGLASVLLDRGEPARALAIVQELDIPASDAEGHLVHVHWARGRVLAATGDDVAAAAAFDRGWEIQDSFSHDVGAIWAGGGAEHVACFARLGRDDDARRLAEHTLGVARARGLAGMEAIALRSLGLLRDDHALLERSVALLEHSPMRLERTRSLVAVGARLRREGRRRDAQDPLRLALDTATACGAGALAATAREELRLAGARPRRDAQTGRDALTAAESRVARLVAAGRSNREVASELFVTVKTVEGHLARIFRKLDVHRRRELAAALRAPDPRDPDDISTPG